MRVLATAVLIAASSLQPFLSQASAQTVVVEVTESESGSPITGAFVSLLDQQGRVLRSALTNDSGRFLFLVPGPGSFQVKAEMIGRETQFSRRFTLRDGESGRIVLPLPVHAIPLEGIRIEADQRCRLHPDEASELSRVWEEARKALTVQAWTEQEGLYRFQISSYERDLDNRARKVEREYRRETSTVARTPIGSLAVEDLMADGFVRPLKGGGHQYHGPDATVLLSDLFLDTHCFRLTRSQDHPASIGLAFEPVRDGELPDIEGTLWLDEETANLQFLEYGYTWAPHEEAKGKAGGRVEFEAMPNGAWIIDRWWIRVPIMAQDRNMIRLGYSGIWVAGIRETGGEVSQVTTLTQQSISEVERGSLTGVVWDSTRFGPLPGATVYLSGTQYSAQTDSEGRFLINGLPEGVFTATFTHPRLDTLGISAQEREVGITLGGASELRLSIPSPGSILLSTCRAEEREAGASVLTGFVRDRASGEPIPAASVRFEWQEIVGMIPNVRALNQWFEVATNGEGRYTACGVPLDEAIVVQASFLEMESDTAHLRFLEEEYRVVDFDIGLPPGFLSARTGALTLREGVGVQGVQGVLIDPESGSPIRSAEVTIRQSPGRVVVMGETNARGFFRLQTPTPGSYLFSARALGYSEVSDEAVEVSMGKLSVLEIQMAPDALKLEPLVVTAQPRAFHLEMQGFYERQTMGLHTGIFISPEVLEERQPLRITDLFYEILGTRVLDTQVGGRGIYFRGGERFNDLCWPMVFLDRHLIRTGGLLSAGADPVVLDDIVSAFDVAAIEVYRTPAEIPPEFNGPNAGCGVVVIWTRRGGGL